MAGLGFLPLEELGPDPNSLEAGMSLRSSRFTFLFTVLFALAVIASAQTRPRAKTAAKGKSTATTQPKYKGIWEPVSLQEDIDLGSVWFVDDKTGWVAGKHGTIMKTTDAGESWTAQLGGDPAAKGPDIADLFFVDATHGFAVGESESVIQNKLLGTSDGETWRQVGTVGTPMKGYRDYAFSSPTNGVFVEGGDGGGIYHTMDGGKTWKPALEHCVAKVRIQGLNKDLPCHLRSVDFVNESLGHAAGASTGGVVFVLRTEDGGASWSYLYVSEPGMGHNDENYFAQHVYFLDDNNGFVAVHRAKKMLITHDGGKTWDENPVPAVGRIRFADPEIGWAAEDNTFSFTTNGGKSWTQREFRFPNRAEAFSLPGRQRAYVVGRNGMVFRYSVVPFTYANKEGMDAPAMPAAKGD